MGGLAAGPPIPPGPSDRPGEAVAVLEIDSAAAVGEQQKQSIQ